MKNKKEIFSDKDLAEIYLYLSRGDLPVKYTYKTDKGSEAWMVLENLQQEGDYKPFAIYESDLLLKNKNSYLSELKNENNEIVIFDFGPGEGRPVEKFLEDISKTKKVFYHAFDISENILIKNKERISKISENIICDFDVVDFEDSNFFDKVIEAKEKYKNRKVLGLFLGSTVGNFSSIDSILKNILSPFSTEDRLIVGVAKSDLKDNIWIKKTVDGYSGDKARNMSTTTIDFLGVGESTYDYGAEFDEKIGAINTTATFKENTEIEIKGKKLEFKKGQKIRLSKSEKVDDVKMTKIFDDLNIRIVNMSTSEDDNYVQFCLSNKNYF